MSDGEQASLVGSLAAEPEQPTHQNGTIYDAAWRPVSRPVAFRVPRVVDDKISKTEFRLFDDEDEARRAACDIGSDYDGLYLVADYRPAAFHASQVPSRDLSTPEKRNAFYGSAEYRDMTTAEKCVVQGDGFINDCD